MLVTNTITPREILRNYKGVFDKIKKTNQPTVVISQKTPQVAIISLEDLERLKKIKAQEGSLRILQLALDNKDALKSLPADLRDSADEILYKK